MRFFGFAIPGTEPAPARVVEQIRFIGDMQRLEAKPGDRFVLSCDQHLSDEMIERLKRDFELVAGKDAKLVVLGRGMKLGILGEAKAA